MAQPSEIFESITFSNPAFIFSKNNIKHIMQRMESRPKESHPQPLAERCVNLSIHSIGFRTWPSVKMNQGYAKEGPENLAVLRHITLTLMRREKTAKLEVKNKRLKAGWDDNYPARVVFGQ
ncbi:hypothetical protein [Desulfogranum marinum]|uniref:hypothetical protein n=1 Tax=Desulfogranum marinum TaxID=453220 RepID=UPI00374DE1FC